MHEDSPADDCGAGCAGHVHRAVQRRRDHLRPARAVSAGGGDDTQHAGGGTQARGYGASTSCPNRSR
jgi:hypothetical protein